jgi:hypothetical protein
VLAVQIVDLIQHRTPILQLPPTVTNVRETTLVTVSRLGYTIASKRLGVGVPFLIFLKSFEVLLYEIMSWIVFYPRTLWRAVRHPLRMMKRSETELKLQPADQFRDIISPPIFLLLTVIAAYGFEVGVVGSNPLIDNGIGLAGLIQDNTSLILFRLINFASLPMVAAALGIAAKRQPLDRGTLQPLFYGQCFATTPVVLLCTVAATLSRLPNPMLDYLAFALLGVAAIFYLGVETAWFATESGRSKFGGFRWAITAFLCSLVVLLLSVIAFAGE